MSGVDLNNTIGEEIPENFSLEEEKVREGLGVGAKEGFSVDLGFLRAETGLGTIEERLEHPLNFSHSRGVARVIRGLEGLFGSLNLAIVDIILGLLEVVKERRLINAG